MKLRTAMDILRFVTTAALVYVALVAWDLIPEDCPAWMRAALVFVGVLPLVAYHADRTD
jgi:hypothetical protein